MKRVISFCFGILLLAAATVASAQTFYGPETLRELYQFQGIRNVTGYINRALTDRGLVFRINDSQAAKIVATFPDQLLDDVGNLTNSEFMLGISVALNGPHGLVFHDGGMYPDPEIYYYNNSDVAGAINHLMALGGFLNLKHSLELVNAVVDYQNGNFYPINNWTYYQAQGMYQWMIGNSTYYMNAVISPTMYDCCPADNDPWDYDYYGGF